MVDYFSLRLSKKYTMRLSVARRPNKQCADILLTCLIYKIRILKKWNIWYTIGLHI